MDPVQQIMFKAITSVERASAQAETLEGVSADFFRLYLAIDKSTPEEFKAALGAVSEKLLAQHAQAIQVKDASLLAVQDIKNAMAKAKAAAEGGAQPPKSNTAPPALAAVPDPEPTEEAGE